MYCKPTTEVNGVTVEVTLPNTWNEMDNCVRKINQQLSYLDNVYYDIPNFDNTRKIYRHEHFQFAEKGTFKSMHISLKNIYYPIPWDKLGIPAIDIPVALRFDDYSEIKPIFNRENIQVNAQALRAIKDKLVKVADYFIGEYNAKASKFESIRHAYRPVKSSAYNLDFYDRTFSVKDLAAHSTIQLLRGSVPNIKDVNLSFWVTNFSIVLELFSNKYRVEKAGSEYVYYEGRKSSNFKYHINGIDSGYDVYIVNGIMNPRAKSFLKRRFKDSWNYLVSEYTGPTYASRFESVVKVLSTKAIGTAPPPPPDEELRTELQELYNQIRATFVDWTGFEETQEFKDWMEQQRELAKLGQASSAVYAGLNKQKGDVTIYTARPHKVETVRDTVWGKSSAEPETLNSWKGLNVICEKDSMTPLENAAVSAFIRHTKIKYFRFLSFNLSEHDRAVSILRNKVTLKQFIKMKPLTRLATALYIQEILDVKCNHFELAKEQFKEVETCYDELVNYKAAHLVNAIDKNVKKLIIKNAFVNNDWDMTIFHQVKKFKDFTIKFGFLRVFDRYAIHSTESDKRLLANMMFIMLKHQKITSSLVSDYHLTKDEEEVDATEQAYLETDKMINFV